MAPEADARMGPVPLLPNHDAQSTTESPFPDGQHESSTSGSESEGSQNLGKGVTIESAIEEDEEEADDMSVEKLRSGSDLTAQVEAESGRMLDDWYESDEVEILTANGLMVVDEEEDMYDDDAGVIDSDDKGNWGNDSD